MGVRRRMKYIDEDLDFIFVRLGTENKSLREMSLEEFYNWLKTKLSGLKNRSFKEFVDILKLDTLEDAWEVYGYEPLMIARQVRKDWGKEH